MPTWGLSAPQGRWPARVRTSPHAYGTRETGAESFAGVCFISEFRTAAGHPGRQPLPARHLLFSGPFCQLNIDVAYAPGFPRRPGSRSVGMSCARVASTTSASRSVKNRQLPRPLLSPHEIAVPATAADTPMAQNSRLVTLQPSDSTMSKTSCGGSHRAGRWRVGAPLRFSRVAGSGSCECVRSFPGLRLSPAGITL